MKSKAAVWKIFSFFLFMDGVSGLEEGAKTIFPHVTVQRCIVHLIRNSIKYVPNKDYKHFTAQLKRYMGSPPKNGEGRI